MLQLSPISVTTQIMQNVIIIILLSKYQHMFSATKLDKIGPIFMQQSDARRR